jgi:hypothetical protein
MLEQKRRISVEATLLQPRFATVSGVTAFVRGSGLMLRRLTLDGYYKRVR